MIKSVCSQRITRKTVDIQIGLNQIGRLSNLRSGDGNSLNRGSLDSLKLLLISYTGF